MFQIVLSISGKGFSVLVLFLMSSYINKTYEEVTHPQDQSNFLGHLLGQA